VDDQLSGQEVLRGLLMADGYNLVFAGEGTEALAIAAELTPDLVLLDVMMPGMDGFDVCRHLRASEQLAETPVIMVTSLDDRESRLEGLEAGADDFVSKPYNRAELRARVRTLTRLNYHRRMHIQALQLERDRTRAILEAVGEAVMVYGPDGGIEYVNPAASDLYGYAYQEFIGQDWYSWQNIQTQSDLHNAILERIDHFQTWRGEVTSRNKDGELRDVALTVAPLIQKDTDAEPTGFVSVHRDISPLKRAEKSKTEFVSNVSHELRTPLSVITLLSDNLETLYDRLPDQKRRKMIRDIQKHTQVLNDLIGDVLEISRIDSGRVSMERTQLDLRRLVREQVRELMPLVQDKFQMLQVLGNGQLELCGNRAQLGQVVRNLLNNAIKYTPEGGQIECEYASLYLPGLDATALDTWPGLANLSGHRWAAVRVTDNGVGMAVEHQEHLFERFYRIKSEQKIRGTGLGLSIARDLVTLHNGQIAVRSEPGVGSTFAVYLPLQVEKDVIV
jgi:PAS domain S-box-containing protein